ncbi:hypothetical protein [Angustibacter luteus]|uniref:Uncharacterized protein n=1 Tax=Angustibacter luteus TaxID=658456 RepID=A0ABW1JIZ7_9ACTN
MAQIRNVSGQDLDVPWEDRVVPAGEVLELDERDVWSYTQQEGVWEPADEAAQTEHDNRGLRRPRGGDTREAWVAWVVGTGQAAEDELEDLGRDQIRDLFTPQEG